MTERTTTHSLKPAWWAMVRTRDLLSQWKSPGQPIDVQDIVPQRTQAILFERSADGRGVLVLWRNDDPGAITFAHAALTPVSAQDIFGAPVSPEHGGYAVGKVPVIFTLDKTAAAARAGLGRLWVRDGDAATEPAWPQRVLATFTAASPDKAAAYSQSGGIAARLEGRTPTGTVEQLQAIAFAAPGASERFTLDVPPGSGLVLRKRYRLDQSGQLATVTVNGRPIGKWDLRRTEAALSEGLRDAVFIIDAAQLANAPRASVELKYDTPANTIAWSAFEYRPKDAGDFPLSALGPVHADQQVGPIRLARNIVGSPLKVDVDAFANGIGAYANSLLEYPLNGQFKRFTAKAGVDAATEGKGSVVFEVWGDGRKLWTSGILSGLDRAKSIDLDVTNVNRLRLIVNDAGDGNKFDAADWCDPILKR